MLQDEFWKVIFLWLTKYPTGNLSYFICWNQSMETNNQVFLFGYITINFYKNSSLTILPIMRQIQINQNIVFELVLNYSYGFFSIEFNGLILTRSDIRKSTMDCILQGTWG